MDCALTAVCGSGGGGGGGGGGAMGVAAAASSPLVLACWSDTRASGAGLGPAKLADGPSIVVLSCASGACSACFAKSASACETAAAGKSSLETAGEGASLSWLSVSVALLGADVALVTAGTAPTPVSPFCDEAEAKGEVGAEPSVTCPLA